MLIPAWLIGQSGLANNYRVPHNFDSKVASRCVIFSPGLPLCVGVSSQQLKNQSPVRSELHDYKDRKVENKHPRALALRVQCELLFHAVCAKSTIYFAAPRGIRANMSAARWL